MSRPSVAVIVPVFNGERYVGEALDSAFAQSHRPIDVIVVNDGSTDAGESAISAYRDRITYCSQSHRGIAAAYNTGIGLSDADFICFLEQDDVWLPTKIERDLDALRSHPSAGMVYSRYYLGDEAARYNADAVSQLAFEGHCFADLFAATLEGDTLLPFSSVCVRREVLQAIGPLDTQLKVSIDYSLWLRIAYRYEIARIDEPTWVYRRHSGNTSRSAYVALRDDAEIVEEWAAFADARRLLGDNVVRERLRSVYDALSWICYSTGRYREERLWRLKQARNSGYSFSDCARFGATLFPIGFRRLCAWYWNRLNMARARSHSESR